MGHKSGFWRICRICFRRFRMMIWLLLLFVLGRLVWPIAETNHTFRELSIENIQTELRLLPNDQWALDNFRAAFAGASIRLSGTITNASAVRDWEFLRTKKPTPAIVWQERLRR